jgi:hypothetical protein
MNLKVTGRRERDEERIPEPFASLFNGMGDNSANIEKIYRSYRTGSKKKVEHVPVAVLHSIRRTMERKLSKR